MGLELEQPGRSHLSLGEGVQGGDAEHGPAEEGLPCCEGVIGGNMNKFMAFLEMVLMAILRSFRYVLAMAITKMAISNHFGYVGSSSPQIATKCRNLAKLNSKWGK